MLEKLPWQKKALKATGINNKNDITTDAIVVKTLKQCIHN